MHRLAATVTSLALLPFLAAAPAHAGGTLTPKGSSDAARVQMLDHHVEVLIQNGFARTEVSQTYFNPGAQDLEAIYSFPVPESACLSEMTILAGERQLEGEVVRAEEARRIYEEERDAGADAGLAEQNSYIDYRFSIARVPAQAETSFRFVYYQALEVDTGVGRYVYPLEEGGTDELAQAFWQQDRQVHRDFSFHVELRSAWPVEKLRLPGFESAAVVESIDEGHWEATLAMSGGTTLANDLVVYYRLRDDLPGRVELLPYRADDEGPGTFMLVVTPGIDLAPLSSGADYVFVLDVSGSMQVKLATLADGVARALGELNPEDRFRVVTFNNRARALSDDLRPATPENVAHALRQVQALTAEGSTDLYAGLAEGLDGLDADRATSLVLVTDAVTNTGELAPQRFRALLASHDVRVFGFLLGNGANWPLMRTICDVSGGFYAGISNADDISGQLLLAKSKVTHECLHQAELEIEGVRTFDVTRLRSKVYRGQQLVLFGRYAEAGPIEIRLKARLTGEDRVYRTTTTLPAVDVEAPEIERLWAMDRIEEFQLAIDRDELDAAEGEQAIADLGVAYQLVTDHTSMLVLEDAAFARHNLARANQERVGREREAQARRQGQVAVSRRVDAHQPAFPSNAPSLGAGGGALDPATLVLVLAGVVLVLTRSRR